MPMFYKSYFVAPEVKSVKSLFRSKKTLSKIQNRQGEVIFEMKNVESPVAWSQLAVDIAASKYFRGPEKSVFVLVERITETLRAQAVAQKVLSSKEAHSFKKDLQYLLLSQKGAFNSPVWFNVGLFQSYGLKSKAPHFSLNFKTQKIELTQNTFERPQGSACFIQSVDDSIEGLFELLKTEAQLFRYGSGTGSNFSKIRSRYEKISGGGSASGLISFLEIFDKGAAAIKSGGTTRRAAKMVVVDDDHPEVFDFIQWKRSEEKKAQLLIKAGLSSDFEGEAYKTISGQNSNNSVRLSDRYMKAFEGKNKWSLRARSSGKVTQTVDASELIEKMAESAWVCADPGVQFDDTIHRWHTCKASGKINSSNPCSEFMFLDDTACNLASLNLVQFLDEDGQFDFESYYQAIRCFFIAQEILIDFCSYPTKKIAQNSVDYRPLGLGFANLGSLLMRKGLSYDSDSGRAWAAGLTAMMTGAAFSVSAELAVVRGPFKKFKLNKHSVVKVLSLHQKALKQIDHQHLPEGFSEFLDTVWKQVLYNAKKKGIRNSQVTVIAPTGTIGFLMDCDTTGIEPDYSLIKYKKLAGGGEKMILNQSVGKALQILGYNEKEQAQVQEHILKTGDVIGSILRPEHQSVFWVAASGSPETTLSPESHLKMMAVVQPFISGAISKTVNLPKDTTVSAIQDIYYRAWKMGLKSVAVYRDGSKQSQPLNSQGGLLCPQCQTETQLSAGCYRCPNCGTTVGCA